MKINTVIVREPDGELTVEVAGVAMQGVASVVLRDDGQSVAFITVPLINAELMTRRASDNVVPFRPVA
jgi:hypothetical protein